MQPPRPILSALAVMLAVASTATADRRAIERVLDEMERAVLAGDQQAYLAHVAVDDPFFRTEQVNWAKDLALHVPASFQLAISDPGPMAPLEQQPSFGTHLATFDLVMNWSFGDAGGDQEPRTRTITLPVSFARTGDEDDAPWLYRGERWVVIVDEHHRVLCMEGFEEAAHRVIEVLPEVREHVAQVFGTAGGEVQQVKIYPDMRHLQHSIYLSYTDPLSGWNEPGEAVKILASTARSTRSLRAVLGHEYGHVATFAYGPRSSDMPWWVLEGAAELASEKWTGTASAPRAVRNWAKRDRLAPWDALADFRNTPDHFGSHVYKQGQHMLNFITERFGGDARNEWLRAMAHGDSLDEASRTALGLPFDELDAAWRAEVVAMLEQEAKDGD